MVLETHKSSVVMVTSADEVHSDTFEVQPVTEPPTQSLLQKQKKSICWGTATFYVFPAILGDHPSVSEGAPIALGGKHTTKSELAIDYYEYLRESHRPRRRRKELFLPGTVRDAFLLSMGYTLQELVEASEEIRKIRKSRQANMKGKWEKLFKHVFDRKNPAARKEAQAPRKPVIMAAKCG